MRGRAAYRRRAWDDAYRSLALADGAGLLSVADLERLAWSAGLTGRTQEFLGVLERLYNAHLEAGHERGVSPTFISGHMIDSRCALLWYWPLSWVT